MPRPFLLHTTPFARAARAPEQRSTCSLRDKPTKRRPRSLWAGRRLQKRSPRELHSALSDV